MGLNGFRSFFTSKEVINGVKVHLKAAYPTKSEYPEYINDLKTFFKKTAIRVGQRNSIDSCQKTNEQI